MTTMQNKEQEENSMITASAGGNELKRQALEVAEEARAEEYTQPSFSRKMFMGDFDSKMMYPFPEQDPADKKIGDEYIEKISSFLKSSLDPDEVDHSREIPKEVIKGLADLGAFAIKIPKEYGGLGFSQTNYNRIIMAVASYCASTAVLLSAHQSIGVPQPLKMFGTEEQKKKWFPKFRTGTISAFALTEPDVGSDPAQMSCEAKLSEDGTHYILNGDKLWCTNGALADVIVVMAKTAPKMVKGKEKKQISAFILDMNTPGIEMTHRCEFMGLGGIYNAAIKFTNVKIPAENLLWQEGRGLALALATINVGRLTLPSACLAGAKQCLTIVKRWGKKRVQWGMPIGEHEAGSEKIAKITALTFAMEAMAKLTCAWLDQKKADIRIEAAMAKMFCTEALWEITDLTMQLRGGRGYEKSRSLKARGEPGYPVEQLMRDCRINLILEGSTEIMKLFLAREAMEPHLEKAGDLLKNTPFGTKAKAAGKVMAFYSQWYPAQIFKSMYSNSYKDMGSLAKHFAYVEKNSHKLARTIFYYMASYQQKLEKRQMILGRLMEIGTGLFAMASTCAYAASLNTDSAREIADYFCNLTTREIEKNYASLTDNDDRQANKIAKEVLDQKFEWLEEGVIPFPPEK